MREGTAAVSSDPTPRHHLFLDRTGTGSLGEGLGMTHAEVAGLTTSNWPTFYSSPATANPFPVR